MTLVFLKQPKGKVSNLNFCYLLLCIMLKKKKRSVPWDSVYGMGVYGTPINKAISIHFLLLYATLIGAEHFCFV